MYEEESVTYNKIMNKKMRSVQDMLMASKQGHVPYPIYKFRHYIRSKSKVHILVDALQSVGIDPASIFLRGEHQ